MPLTNHYRALGPDFSQDVAPTAAPAPVLLLWNEDLAAELGINDMVPDASERGQIFAGNRRMPGSEPVALAYAGHQFGHFVPQLGDGRAHLLGEVRNAAGRTFDIQLKGSGTSRFSRAGDGRCGLGPAVREFIMSEAMHALGVPTTRSLAVVTTGEIVYRQQQEPGAVVTRVASSHLRVGTFEYFAARKKTEAIETLLHFAAERHGPATDKTGAELALHVFDSVIARQIHLVTEWMRVGFIHGVMNTDNTTISGETIDYGPCAMMGIYDPSTVYSSIDRLARYAFGKQAAIMQWNMARFVECLIPLIHDNQEEAIAIATDIVRGIGARFEKSWLAMMGRKLGLSAQKAGDEDLVSQLLKCLEEQKLDYTRSFNELTRSLAGNGESPVDLGGIDPAWIKMWHARIENDNGQEAAYKLMRRTNPAVIPRNHHVEAALKQIASDLNADAIADFLQVLRAPYEEGDLTGQFQDLPADGDCHYQTFCGT